MRKPYIRHENLRKAFEKFINTDMDELTDEDGERLLNELKHSCLIIAADRIDGDMDFRVLEIGEKEYGILFSDMDEFRKTFSDDECESYSFDFEIYQKALECGLFDGFLFNPNSEGLLIEKELFLRITDLPQSVHDHDNAYETEELVQLRKSIDNGKLEQFLADSSNIGNYEGLINCMADSVMLTLMLSRDDLRDYADDGIINMAETGPLGFLYTDEVGGQYSTLFTSEEKMKSVDTEYMKYFQIVNVSIMTNFVLNDDMDGIIINPGSDNVLLSRDVLLEYSSFIEKACNDEKLNSAIFHLFLMENHL